MALDVQVKIQVATATGSVGFGVPLLLETGATTAVAFTECYDIDDVVKAGFEATTAMYKAAQMVFQQVNRPEKIAISASSSSAIEAITAVVDNDWRQLVIVNDVSDTSEYIAIADYIETLRSKMYFVAIGSDKWNTFKNSVAEKKYDRTVFFINSTEYAAAALVGEMSGRTAGSATYKFKTLKGVAAEYYTDAQIQEFHKAGAFCYVTRAGDDITTEGISQSGKYLDLTDSIDYVIQNIEYRIQKVFNTTAKVHFDDRGIALLEAATVSALQEAANNGIIAVKEDGSYDYSVSFGSRSQTSEEERASREYKYGSFKFALAGAVHSCTVAGEITY